MFIIPQTPFASLQENVFLHNKINYKKKNNLTPTHRISSRRPPLFNLKLNYVFSPVSNKIKNIYASFKKEGNHRLHSRKKKKTNFIHTSIIFIIKTTRLIYGFYFISCKHLQRASPHTTVQNIIKWF